MKNSLDIFPYMIDQPGASIDSSLFVTASRPLDAKRIVSSWYPEDRQVIDGELVYEGLTIYSVKEKKIYVCIEKPEDALTANDCTWDVCYGGEGTLNIKECNNFEEAQEYASIATIGQLVIVNNATDNDNTDGTYIVINGSLIRIDNRYMYGTEYDKDAQTTRIGGIAKGTKLSTLISETNGGDISRIIDKLLFTPSAPAVVLSLTENSSDKYHNINTNLQVETKADDYGIYFSTSSNIRKWTFSLAEYVPDQIYIDGVLTNIDALAKYELVSSEIDIENYNRSCGGSVVYIDYSDYISNPSHYSDLSNAVVHISKSYLDSIGGTTEGAIMTYNTIVSKLKDNTGYHFIAYGGCKGVYNKMYQSRTTAHLTYANPSIAFNFNERTSSSDSIVGTITITPNIGSGSIVAINDSKYLVNIYEYVDGTNDIKIAQVSTNNTSYNISSNDFVSGKKFELSSNLNTSKGYVNETHSYYATLQMIVSYPGLDNITYNKSSVASKKIIYAINNGTYNGSSKVENVSGTLQYKYSFNRINVNSDYNISYGVVVNESGISDSRIAYTLGVEKSRAATASKNYSAILYATAMKIKNSSKELIGTSSESLYTTSASSPTMSGPSYTISATLGRDDSGKVKLSNIKVSGTNNDSIVGGYTLSLNGTRITDTTYTPGDTISDQTGLEFSKDYIFTLTLSNVTLNGVSYTGNTTFNSSTYNLSPTFTTTTFKSASLARSGSSLVLSYKASSVSDDYTRSNPRIQLKESTTTSWTTIGTSLEGTYSSGLKFSTTYNLRLIADVTRKDGVADSHTGSAVELATINSNSITPTFTTTTFNSASLSKVDGNVKLSYLVSSLPSDDYSRTNLQISYKRADSNTWSTTSAVIGTTTTLSNNLDFGVDYNLRLLATVTRHDGVTDSHTGSAVELTSKTLSKISASGYSYTYAGSTSVTRSGNTLVASYKFTGSSGDYQITNLAVTVNDGSYVNYTLGDSVSISNIVYGTSYSVKLYGKISGASNYTQLASGTISAASVVKPTASTLTYSISSDYNNPIVSNPKVTLSNSSTMSFTNLTYKYVLTQNGTTITNTNNTWTINYNTAYTLTCYASGTAIDGVTKITDLNLKSVSVTKGSTKPTITLKQINGITATSNKVTTTGVASNNSISSVKVGLTAGSGSQMTIQVSNSNSFSTIYGSTTASAGTTETTITLSNFTTNPNVSCPVWIRVYDNVTPSTGATTLQGTITFTYTAPVVTADFYVGVMDDKDGFGKDCFNYKEYEGDTPVLTDSTPTKLNINLDTWTLYTVTNKTTTDTGGYVYVIVPSNDYTVNFAINNLGAVGDTKPSSSSAIPYKSNTNSVYYYTPGGAGQVWLVNSSVFIKISKK